MTAQAWFVGFLVIAWLMGYGLGRVFLNLRQFIDKVK